MKRENENQPPPHPTPPNPIPYLNWPNRVYSIQPQRISAEVCAPSNHANGVHLLDLRGDALLSTHLSYVKHFWNAMSACWLFTVNFMMSHSLMIYTELLKPFVIFRIIHGHWGALLDGMLYVINVLVRLYLMVRKRWKDIYFQFNYRLQNLAKHRELIFEFRSKFCIESCWGLYYYCRCCCCLFIFNGQ